MINIALDREEVELGRILSGVINLTDSKQGNFSAILAIGWHTEGRGSIDREQVSEKVLQFLEANLSVPFNIQVPYNSPISYDGKLMRIIWELTVEVKDTVLFIFTTKKQASVPFRVLPRSSVVS